MPHRPQPAVALALLLAAAAAAATAQRPEVDLAALRAHASFLADDRLEGRETGSAGYEIAALYAATRFEQYGLAPGAGGGYLQPVRFVETRPAGVRFAFAATEAPDARAAPSGALRETLAELEDFVMTGSLTARRSEVSAPVVFAGYGIDAPGLGLTDYEGLEVAGKVVLVLSGAPASFPNDQRAHFSSRRQKAEEAQRRGAVGLLTVRDRVDEKRTPWERIVAYAARPRTAWIAPDGAIQDSFPGLAFAATLSRPGAERLLAAAGLALEPLLDAAERLDSRRGELPLTVDVACDNRIDEVASPNVAALLPGSDPALAAEHVVVTAHLDHVGIGRPVDGDAIHNGFFDNALGSAIVLETARLLAASPERPRRSVLFLLVAGEERGLLGADYFVHQPTVPAASIVANVNVDMPLLLAPLADLVAFGAEHSTLGASAEAAARAQGFALIPDPMPEEVVFVRSDQYPFVRRGIPAIYLTAGSGTLGGGDAQARAGLDFLARHYHRPSDELELGADWESVARFTATEADLVRRIADAPERPRWHPGDFFGETFGASGAR